MSVCELQCDLVVSTPTPGLFRTSSLCARCPVEVEGRIYKVNLICLPLQELEVILGMEWLFTNRVLIDCREKRLLFSNSEEPELLSFQDPKRCIVLHYLHTSRGGERGKDDSYTSGARV